jgi:hypothetical protein
MVEGIISTVFSLPYLGIGIFVAALLDLSIYYTKSSDRLTMLEIWGCVAFWPIVLIVFLISLIKGE